MCQMHCLVETSLRAETFLPWIKQFPKVIISASEYFQLLERTGGKLAARRSGFCRGGGLRLGLADRMEGACDVRDKGVDIAVGEDGLPGRHRGVGQAVL